MPAGLIHTVRHEARYAWSEWRAAAVRKRKARLFERWLRRLRRYPPDALIGPNINPHDGVRNHLLGIVSHSSLEVELAPDDDLMASLRADELYTTFRQSFLNYVPRGIKAVHSHVYPYFVEWCQHHRESGVRWVHTYHLPYFADPPDSELLAWQVEMNDAGINIGRHAHVRISVSRWQQKYLASRFGIDTTYVPNGVDVTFCDSADANRFTRRFGTAPFVLYVGRDDAVKNPADFVRLARSLPDMRFVMIGNGLNAALFARTANIETPSNLVFTGRLPRAEVQDAIAACSLLVVTSKREGLPTLVLESMTHRKPLVVPDEPGCVEAIGGGEFGLVYEHGDIGDLAGKTLAALADPGIARGGRERVLAEYDWRVIAPQMDAIYLGTAR